MDNVAIIEGVRKAGCLDGLCEVFEIERRLVDKLTIDELFEYHSLRSRLNHAWMAPFYYCLEPRKLCATFSKDPRLCCDMECRMHSPCILCQCPTHGTLEVYDDECITRCEHVRRICAELEVLDRRWQIDVATLWVHFHNYSQ